MGNERIEAAAEAINRKRAQWPGTAVELAITALAAADAVDPARAELVGLRAELQTAHARNDQLIEQHERDNEYGRALTADRDKARAEVTDLRTKIAELDGEMYAQRVDDHYVIYHRATSYGRGIRVEMTDAAAAALAAVLGAAEQIEPQPCGHPNHGTADHDCTPFVAGQSDQTGVSE